MSNTLQKLKSDSHCLSIITRSGKTSIVPLIPVVDKVYDDIVVVDDVPKVVSKQLVIVHVSSQKLIGLDKRVENDKEKGMKLRLG